MVLLDNVISDSGKSFRIENPSQGFTRIYKTGLDLAPTQPRKHCGLDAPLKIQDYIVVQGANRFEGARNFCMSLCRKYELAPALCIDCMDYVHNRPALLAFGGQQLCPFAFDEPADRGIRKRSSDGGGGGQRMQDISHGSQE